MHKRFYLWTTVLYTGACLWLVVSRLAEGQTKWVVCPSKRLFHIPCPGCGITRATHLWFQGNFLPALALNPNVVLAVLFLTVTPVLLLYDLLTRQERLWMLYERAERMLHLKKVNLPFALFEAAVWIHNIYCHI